MLSFGRSDVGEYLRDEVRSFRVGALETELTAPCFCLRRIRFSRGLGLVVLYCDEEQSKLAIGFPNRARLSGARSWDRVRRVMVVRSGLGSCDGQEEWKSCVRRLESKQ